MRVAAGLEVADSPLHGRGLFAVKAVPAGQCLAVSPLLILEADEVEALKATRLYHYVFHVADLPDGRMQAGVAFGPVSLCNHSSAPNAAFRVDGISASVVLTSIRAIWAGEEILIDYGDFAGEAVA